MSTIAAAVNVCIPPSGAIDALADYFRERDHVVDAELPLRSLGLPTSLRLCRTVCVSVTIVPDPTDRRPAVRDALRVSWRPTARGAGFPALEGMLTVRPGPALGSALSLHAAYQPPFGIAGTLFDAIIGSKIAAATARALLADMKAALERSDLAWRDSLAFAGYEANLRQGANDVGVPLHGAVSVRHEGSYLACHIRLDGTVEPDALATIASGDYYFGEAAAAKVLHELDGLTHAPPTRPAGGDVVRRPEQSSARP